MIKALIFDIDGVLVDSEVLSILITQNYFKSIGYNVGGDKFSSHLGIGMEDLIEGTAKECGFEVPLSDAFSFFKKEYSEKIKKNNIALPGAKDIIYKALRSGLKCAVCSSAPRWRVLLNLENIGVKINDLSAVISYEDAKRNKPFPDIYRRALLELGIDENEALVFEDSYGGIQSAKSAGCYVCALETTINEKKCKEAGAGYVIKDLSFFPDFSSFESFNSLFLELKRGKDALKYGNEWIVPLKKKLPKDVVEKDAIQLAYKAMLNAYAPYSNFRVGAAVVSASTGAIYSGCNVENASYGATICAERNAITTAITNEGKLGIEMLVIVSEVDPPAPPCAICRQVINEFSREDTPILLVSSKSKVVERYTFKDLLPHPFVFKEDE